MKSMRLVLPSIVALERHPQLATVLALETTLQLAERALLAIDPDLPPTTASRVADMLLLQMQMLGHGLENYRDALDDGDLD
jgi:hypothetical protein